MDVFPQGVPLAEKQVLEVGIEGCVLGQVPAVALDRLRLAQADVLVRPVQPAFHAEMALYGHVKGVVVQPRVFLAEGRHRRLVPGIPGAERLAQDGEPGLVNPAVVDGPGGVSPADVLQVPAGQQAVLRQQVQVDKVGIAGEGGKALIWAVAVAGGSQGQELPVFLSGGAEEVGEGVRLPAQGADAVRRGKGGNGQKDAAAAFHKITLSVIVL